jgi:hypothetical protein
MMFGELHADRDAPSAVLLAVPGLQRSMSSAISGASV